MTEMIARIARVLEERAHEHAGRPEMIARIVMEAAREPTADMLSIHEEMAGNELCDDAGEETLARVYRAMIDIALGSPLKGVD